MSYKTKSNYKSQCTKKCANKGIKCDTCIKWKGEYIHYIKLAKKA